MIQLIFDQLCLQLCLCHDVVLWFDTFLVCPPVWLRYVSITTLQVLERLVSSAANVLTCVCWHYSVYRHHLLFLRDTNDCLHHAHLLRLCWAKEHCWECNFSFSWGGHRNQSLSFWCIGFVCAVCFFRGRLLLLPWRLVNENGKRTWDNLKVRR